MRAFVWGSGLRKINNIIFVYIYIYLNTYVIMYMIYREINDYKKLVMLVMPGFFVKKLFRSEKHQVDDTSEQKAPRQSFPEVVSWRARLS